MDINKERDAFEDKYTTAKRLVFADGRYQLPQGSSLPESVCDGLNEAWIDFQAGAAWQRTQSAWVPECVQAWYDAKLAHVEAVDAYNARLAFVEQHMPFGTSVDPEYQLMEAANRKVRELVYPMFLGLKELLAAAPAQPAAQGEFGDAYQGAREDLAIWKRRALEAEARVRQQDQIIDQMGEDLNAINGPTFMGEPVIPAAQDQGEVHSRERWTVMCGHWQDTTLAIHGERTGHIASGIDEDAAHAIVNAHNQGLPPIAAASTGQEV